MRMPEHCRLRGGAGRSIEEREDRALERIFDAVFSDRVPEGDLYADFKMLGLDQAYAARHALLVGMEHQELVLLKAGNINHYRFRNGDVLLHKPSNRPGETDKYIIQHSDHVRGHFEVARVHEQEGPE